ncbi:MAG: LysR family transcriptional regulator, partial [Mucilaginibacter sp.]|nr:LysR family transcriptional regulator [Mucilaginibacter sp.]
EVTDVHSLLDLVTFGLGVALVPQSFAAKTDRARFVPLAGVPPQWETVTVTGDPVSPAAAALLHEVHLARGGHRALARS